MLWFSFSHFYGPLGGEEKFSLLPHAILRLQEAPEVVSQHALLSSSPVVLCHCFVWGVAFRSYLIWEASPGIPNLLGVFSSPHSITPHFLERTLPSWSASFSFCPSLTVDIPASLGRESLTTLGMLPIYAMNIGCLKHFFPPYILFSESSQNHFETF